MQVPFWNALGCSQRSISRAWMSALVACLFHQLASQSLVLAIENCGRLFVVFAFFPFADDAFLFHHALETLDGFFEVLGIFNVNRRHVFFTSFLRKSRQKDYDGFFDFGQVRRKFFLQGASLHWLYCAHADFSWRGNLLEFDEERAVIFYYFKNFSAPQNRMRDFIARL